MLLFGGGLQGLVGPVYRDPRVTSDVIPQFR